MFTGIFAFIMIIYKAKKKSLPFCLISDGNHERHMPAYIVTK